MILIKSVVHKNRFIKHNLDPAPRLNIANKQMDFIQFNKKNHFFKIFKRNKTHHQIYILELMKTIKQKVLYWYQVSSINANCSILNMKNHQPLLYTL